MKDFKRYILALFSLSICAVLLLVSWYLYPKNKLFTKKSDQFVQDKEALTRLLQNSSEIHRLWNEGEESREWKTIRPECLKHFKISTAFDETLLRCNPMILQCNNLFNKKRNYHFIDLDAGREQTQNIYRYLSKSNSNHIGLGQGGYLFRIEDNLTHQKIDLLLADHCQEVFLQNRIYAYGEEVTGSSSEVIEDYRFDNFNQNIYIDRHLVTNAEVNEWIKFGNPDHTNGLEKIEADGLFMPATQLNYFQMENYCSFKGKQILQAHYFDASTFLPMDLSEVMPKKNNRSPYYWTKKKSEFREDCSMIYAQDCIKKQPFRMNSTSPSWSGIQDAMGGTFEAFRNPIDPESNLKASSYYFNFKSPWHKLGFRANWDGEGFELRHFDFKGINPEISIDKFKVGFRCMRESK